MIKVYGHKVPDTDSTVSSIIIAWYLNNIVGEEATAFLPGEISLEADYVLKRWGIEIPQKIKSVSVGDKVFIVDTNNPEELIEGTLDAELVGLIDHHKITPGLKSDSPIEFNVKPYASTSTIIYIEYLQGEDVPKEILGLVLSGILSDTLNGKSSTTTEVDLDVIDELSEELDVNPDELASQQFEAKSDVSKLSDRELVLSDAKNFESNGKSFKVGVIETVLPQKPIERINSMVSEILSIKKEENLDYFFLFIVDIVQGLSIPVYASDSEKSILEKAFKTLMNGNGEYLMSPIEATSRKKELLPALINVI